MNIVVVINWFCGIHLYMLGCELNNGFIPPVQ